MSGVITDVSPRTIMCPLPKGYWWQVRLLQALNSVHLNLHKRRNGGCSIGDTKVVLDFSQKSTDEVVRELINGSYDVWQKFVRSAYQKNDEWERRADELRERLVSTPDTKVKVKAETIR